MRLLNLLNPYKIIKLINNNKYLIKRLTITQIQSMHKGSFLGFIWSVINPILMILIYTFVFSVIFQAKWGTSNNNKFEFALMLYCGLTTFLILQDSMVKAPTLITGRPNYVKKVVFPTEILSIVNVGSVLFNSLIGYGVLLLANLIVTGKFYATSILLPIVIIPMIFIALGISWFFSSLGVYVRDLNSFIGIIATILLFMSPIFYPLSSVPEGLQIFYQINPISHIIEEARAILIYGVLPNFLSLSWMYLISAFIMILGYAWFSKTKDGFADAL